MLDLSKLDLDEIANALADQTDYINQWLINRRTGEVTFWASDLDLPDPDDDEDLVTIDPIRSHVWHGDMADFAGRITDPTASRRLERAIRGKGAFRRFKDELFEEYPDLVSVWQGFRDVRARRRAVGWLLDNGLIADDAGERYLRENPDPEFP